MIHGNFLEHIGLDELIRITLKKCGKALQGDMRSVMSNNISQEIEEILQKENSEIPSYIKEKAVNFVDGYKFKNDNDFIIYIIKIVEYNSECFLEKEMDKNSESIFRQSDFLIDHTQKYIEFYKDKTDNIISEDLSNLALQFLDLQANKEILNGKPILNKNKRNHKQFFEISSKFLKENFYYIAQKKYIFYIIENICQPLSKGFEEKLNQIISKLLKEDIIKKKIDDCFLNKFSKFEERINGKDLLSKKINRINDNNSINNDNNIKVEENNNDENNEIDLPSETEININKNNYNYMNNITNNNMYNNISNNMNNDINNNINNAINNNVNNVMNNNMNIFQGENRIWILI